MAEDRVAIVDLADELQVRKQRIFKLLSRLGIRPTQRREASRGNQNVAMITLEEAVAIRKELVRSAGLTEDGLLQALSSGNSVSLVEDVGYFYLIQLEPEHDPGRFKVCFTTELDGRLQKHRCSAPFARYLKSWLCRRVWERTAIDCVTDGCERLHTEVFRAVSLDAVCSRADMFFSVMPRLVSQISEGQDKLLDDEPPDK
jgi:hypothetical protein